MRRSRETWPGVVEAANLIGSTQVQGRATLAGNLCNASPAADSVPALIAAGAVACIVGPNGRREVPVEEIVTGPGPHLARPRRDSSLEFQLPRAAAALGRRLSALDPAHRNGHRRGRRGVNLTLDADGVCTAPGSALGAVAPTRAAGAGGRRRADRHASWTTAALADAGRGRERRLPADRRQARHHRIPHQDRRRAGAARRRDRARARREERTDGKTSCHATVNGEPVEFLCETQQTLLDVLRDELRPDRHQGRLRLRRLRRLQRHRRRPAGLLLPGAGRRGRGHGDRHHRGHGPGRRSCIRCSEVPRARGAAVRLLHARASWSRPRPLLERNPDPTEDEVRYWLAGNLCRCTGYDKIVGAVLDAAAEMRRRLTMDARSSHWNKPN